MPERPATRTPASADQLRAAMAEAGPDLTAHQQALLLAHVSIETSNGKKLVQHNIGNLIVPGSKESVLPFWRPPWFDEPGPDASERIKRLHAGMLEGKQPRAFRAFDSLAQGVGAYLSSMRGRFSPMLRAGSPEEFVREWRATGYTPDLDVEATTPGFVSLFRKFGGDGPSDGSSGGAGPWLVGGIALGVLWAMKRKRG